MAQYIWILGRKTPIFALASQADEQRLNEAQQQGSKEEYSPRFGEIKNLTYLCTRKRNGRHSGSAGRNGERDL